MTNDKNANNDKSTWEHVLRQTNWDLGEDLGERIPSSQQIGDSTCDNQTSFEGEFIDFDKWLNQDYIAGVNADTIREEGQILSPPLYAGFSNPDASTNDIPNASAPDSMDPLATLRSLVYKLELELEDKTRKLDRLHDYVEELQPWVQEISNLVNDLVDRQGRNYEPAGIH
ncbi:hypothetical protein ACLMJK_007671 [Lecanora helva]